LNNLYRDIYNLTTKLHFDAKYIESITPAERELFLYYAKEEEEKAKKDNQPKEMMLGTPIDPL
jgi:hypothetical protein